MIRHPHIRRTPTTSGGGRPLPPATRTWFESRMGWDFGSVRVHAGRDSADLCDSMGSRALTVGNDIHFNRGEYSPGTQTGRHLLAHELTHVVQPGSVVRRKIRTNGGLSINGYLGRKRIHGVRHRHSVYSTSRTLALPLERQIIYDLLSSGRTFLVDGNSSAQAEQNIDRHVKARKKIVDLAGRRRYSFAPTSRARFNPKFWGKNAGGFMGAWTGYELKAYHDLYNNPQLYAIPCLVATEATMLAGTGNRPLTKDLNVANNDWVPGDWGYITNTNHRYRPIATQGGENIIYSGYGRWWGHTPSANHYNSLAGWFKRVKGWAGAARIETYRKRPNNGLVL